MTVEENTGNKVARVVDLVQDKENGDMVEEEKIKENQKYNGEEDENIEVPVDEWVEDKDEKIMDAKVMKKGDKKLIIVDMPNPKARWVRPS